MLTRYPVLFFLDLEVESISLKVELDWVLSELLHKINNMKMESIMNTDTFEDRIQSVIKRSDKWIGIIEPRLHDLTGQKLTQDKTYPHPRSRENKDRTPINTGKNIVVTFPTEKIAADLGIDDMHEVWRFILGEINIDAVFIESEPFQERKLGEEAQKELDTILSEIRSYKEDGSYDVLGIFSRKKHALKIYAQVIAYYSDKMKVSAEDLSFVVLVHELAHAYTIAGYDINGYRGILLNEYPDRCISEGLAQYYTEAVCMQLESSKPEFLAVFKALLLCQTTPYSWYSNWFQGKPDHEKLRAALIEYRNGSDDYSLRIDTFLSAIEQDRTCCHNII